MEEKPIGIVNDKKQIIDVKKALDAYSNIPANLGIGSKNLAEAASYVMKRFTWDYMTINILFRDNWIAKAIIEKPANEMLKNGFTIQTQLDPDKVSRIMKNWADTTRSKFLDCLKWSRLYGGCLLIPMIEGQEDLSQPLDYDTIQVDSYKGCFVIDRWCGISPSLELEDDISDREFGTPKYYTITSDKINKTVKVHHSRVIKMIGRKLPYWEEITEDYWGASEFEHVFSELKKRDDTSSNISMLIFLANIRVLKMSDLGSMITVGDQEALNRVFKTVQELNSLMCNSGTLMLDKEDDFSMQGYSFTGINDIYESFMLDISGAAEIPIDKLFGRSPSGFNNGEETLQNYYDTIQEKQESYVRFPLEKIIKIICMSTVGEIPDDLDIVFNPVRRSSDKERADLAMSISTPLLEMYNSGIFGKGTVLRELKQQSGVTGMWTNITDEMIEKADEEDEQNKIEEKEAENEVNENLNNILSEQNENNFKNFKNKYVQNEEHMI